MNAQVESIPGYRLSSQQVDFQGGVNVVLVEGPGDERHVEALRGALNRSIAHHEILRTCYRPVAGLRHPLQHVLPRLDSAWKVYGAVVDEQALIRSARALVNLHDGPVIGAALCRSATGGLRWALAVPACSLDGTALQELVLTCLASTEGFAADVIQYPDFAAWQSELQASELGQEGVRFWDKQAATVDPVSRLPFEIVTNTNDSTEEELELPPDAERSLTSLVERLCLPPETVLAALWAGYMARLTQSEDLSFDLHADVRTEELRAALGCFVSKLPLSLQLRTGLPTDALLRSVAEHIQAARSWQDCFDAAAYSDRLVQRGVARDGLEFAWIRTLDLPDGWSVRRVEVEPVHAKLQCLCVVSGGRHVLRWRGSASFVPGTLRTWMRQFATLLESAAQGADRSWNTLSLLGAAEREDLLSASRPRHSFGGERIRTLHSLFEEQAVRTPEALAVVCGTQRLTYRELDRRAEMLANRLRQVGVRTEHQVGIYMGRCADVIAAMLGVLKSGAAYVPLDPAYPAERIRDMVAAAGVATIVCASSRRWEHSSLREVCMDDLVDGDSGSAAAPEISPQQLAYVIYTSGSTGKPKGVMVSHANAIASTRARETFYPERVYRYLLLSSPSFDSSVAGIYWTLTQGGALHIPTEGTHQDPVALAALIAREKISHVLTLPSFYKQILERLGEPWSLQCAIVAGEACHADVVALHREKLPATALVNEYGPTEGTVWSNAFRIETGRTDGLRIPIGGVIDCAYGYVLDERLEPSPVGLPGEWYIGGDGITRGYDDQPGLTAQRFVADPFGTGQRLYRTGDRVRRRPDGELEYLGRADNQVKLRGYRIELDEIDAALLAHERVQEAVALVHEDAARGQQLIGFFVTGSLCADADRQALREALLSHLRRTLPAFMVPTHLVAVARLPLMPNGKVDRSALVALIDRGLRAPYVAPSDETEQALAGIWQEVLKVERVGVRDNFFELGGHSLLATQIVSRIREVLLVDLPLKELFETHTLGELAERVRKLAEGSRDELLAMEALMAEEQE